MMISLLLCRLGIMGYNTAVVTGSIVNPNADGAGSCVNNLPGANTVTETLFALVFNIGLFATYGTVLGKKAVKDQVKVFTYLIQKLDGEVWTFFFYFLGQLQFIIAYELLPSRYANILQTGFIPPIFNLLFLGTLVGTFKRPFETPSTKKLHPNVHKPLMSQETQVFDHELGTTPSVPIRKSIHELYRDNTPTPLPSPWNNVFDDE